METSLGTCISGDHCPVTGVHQQQGIEVVIVIVIVIIYYHIYKSPINFDIDNFADNSFKAQINLGVLYQ